MGAVGGARIALESQRPRCGVGGPISLRALRDHAIAASGVLYVARLGRIEVREPELLRLLRMPPHTKLHTVSLEYAGFRTTSIIVEHPSLPEFDPLADDGIPPIHIDERTGAICQTYPGSP